MKAPRFWIEIAAVGTAVACALALLFATLGAIASALGQTQARPTPAEQTYQGMVTCSRCGARHSAALGKTAADCARICVHGGGNFALVNGDKTYLLEGNPMALKRVAGQRVTIVGVVTGETIRVSSVAAGS